MPRKKTNKPASNHNTPDHYTETPIPSTSENTPITNPHFQYSYQPLT